MPSPSRPAARFCAPRGEKPKVFVSRDRGPMSFALEHKQPWHGSAHSILRLAAADALGDLRVGENHPRIPL
jgi:hypothetical protein